MYADDPRKASLKKVFQGIAVKVEKMSRAAISSRKLVPCGNLTKVSCHIDHKV